MMEFNFTGKKILVTGAGRGIGRAVAITLAKSGCKVYALSRTKSTLDTLVEEIPDIVPIVQDLSNWEETKAKLEVIETLDGLVNNAGISVAPCPSLDYKKEDLKKVLDTNLLGVINCIQVIGKKMVASGKPGSIVNVSSVIAEATVPDILGYSVSKAAVVMVTKQFALELGKNNIRVNSVNPTLVFTDMVKHAMEKGHPKTVEGMLMRIPMERMLTEADAVGPILYLLSDCSAMVTGTSHLVDGGTMCNITTRSN